MYSKPSQLEKFKFVLDYKIKELKRQIEPRENEISDMRHQIEEMDLELEQVRLLPRLPWGLCTAITGIRFPIHFLCVQSKLFEPRSADAIALAHTWLIANTTRYQVCS